MRLQLIVVLLSWSYASRSFAFATPACDCTPLPNVSLEAIVRRHRSTACHLHTGHHRTYDTLLAPLRHTHVRLLEIRPAGDNNSRLWLDYFPSIDLFSANSGTNPVTPTSVMPVTVPPVAAAQAPAAAFNGPFDIIIDGGGPSPTHHVANYEALFANAVRPGGLYLMEGIETSYYWHPVDSAPRPKPAVATFTLLADVVNRKFHDNNYRVTGPGDWWVKSVGFAQNLVVLHKKDVRDQPYDAHYMFASFLHPPARSQGSEQRYGPGPFLRPRKAKGKGGALPPAGPRPCTCGPPGEPSLEDLARRYQPTKFFPYLHTGYHRFYDALLQPLRRTHVRFLEIGLRSGRGTQLWKKYFPDGKLFAIDNAVQTATTAGAKLAEVYVGDQGNRTFLQTVVEASGGAFDVIIDDGGHSFRSQMASYEGLFAAALKPGGLYVIEDIETSYWKSGRLYGQHIVGGVHYPRTTVNKFKRMVDVVNRKFHDNTHNVTGPADFWIQSVSFAQNIIVLRKKDSRDAPYDAHYMWPHKLRPPARDQGDETAYGPSPFSGTARVAP